LKPIFIVCSKTCNCFSAKTKKVSGISHSFLFFLNTTLNSGKRLCLQVIWLSFNNLQVEFARSIVQLKKGQIKVHFTHNIEIKRYCNKKIKRHFSFNIFFLCELKIFFLDNCAYWNIVWKDFKMSLQYFEEENIKMSFYHFIAILCAKILCVTRAWLYRNQIRRRLNKIMAHIFMVY